MSLNCNNSLVISSWTNRIQSRSSKVLKMNAFQVASSPRLDRIQKKATKQKLLKFSKFYSENSEFPNPKNSKTPRISKIQNYHIKFRFSRPNPPPLKAPKIPSPQRYLKILKSPTSGRIRLHSGTHFVVDGADDLQNRYEYEKTADYVEHGGENRVFLVLDLAREGEQQRDSAQKTPNNLKNGGNNQSH